MTISSTITANRTITAYSTSSIVRSQTVTSVVTASPIIKTISTTLTQTQTLSPKTQTVTAQFSAKDVAAPQSPSTVFIRSTTSLTTTRLVTVSATQSVTYYRTVTSNQVITRSAFPQTDHTSPGRTKIKAGMWHIILSRNLAFARYTRPTFPFVPFNYANL